MKKQSDHLSREQARQVSLVSQPIHSILTVAENKLRAAQLRVTQARLDVLSVLWTRQRAMSLLFGYAYKKKSVLRDVIVF